MDSEKDNLSKGVTAALIAAIFLTVMNILSKILAEDLDPVMIAFWRNFFALVILVAGLAVTNNMQLMKTAQLKSQIIRAVIGTAGLILAIWAFSILPLTEAIVIGFTSPLFVILLSYPLLRERVGIYRVGATCIGFIGIIVIVGFDIQSLGVLGVIVTLGWAFFNGVVIIMLRQLGKKDSAMTTTFYFMLIGLVLCGAYVPFADKVIPSQPYWWAVGLLGIVGVISLILKTEAYRHAPASVIAPLAYSILLWTAFLDYIIWNHVASPTIWAGAVIIIAANLFIIWREKQLSKINEGRKV